MPVYEYECENCGYRFERFQSVQDAPIRQCPHCSGHVHKVFHPVGIIFKGSGWYVTDHRKAVSDSHKDKTDAQSDTKTEPPALDTASTQK